MTDPKDDPEIEIVLDPIIVVMAEELYRVTRNPIIRADPNCGMPEWKDLPDVDRHFWYSVTHFQIASIEKLGYRIVNCSSIKTIMRVLDDPIWKTQSKLATAQMIIEKLPLWAPIPSK